jgi:hypothetical protein
MIQLKQNNDIELNGFVLHKDGIEAVGQPTYKQWEKAGEFIKRSHEAVQFWRGDWVNYGELNFDEWSQHFDPDELSSETLRNEKWVAQKVPPVRRRTGLSWTHHQLVAELEPEEQIEMLDMAERNTMSTAVFRKAVQHFKLKLDVPELSDSALEKTSDEVFKSAQACVDASVNAIELLEALPWDKIHIDARDWLISHLKRAGTFYFGLVKKYDRQKRLSK